MPSPASLVWRFVAVFGGAGSRPAGGMNDSCCVQWRRCLSHQYRKPPGDARDVRKSAFFNADYADFADATCNLDTAIGTGPSGWLDQQILTIAAPVARSMRRPPP